MPGVDAFLREAAEALGPRGVVTDPDVVAGHVVDWTGRWRGASPAVLRPSRASDVVAVVRLARQHRVALVPQGGNTGLVGGAVPLAGEVVLDMRRLDSLGDVDLDAGQVTVGAGATLAAVQDHARPHGLSLAVDLAARGTATIGGMVATNAGGLHVVRHGSMRAHVLGVQAVLGTGALIDVNPTGLRKDNTGYDLASLLCGSEGTLGVVTAARLRLISTPEARAVVLLGFGTVEAAVASVPVLRRLPALHAVELVLRAGMELVGRQLGEAVPLADTATCAVLVEVAGAEGGLIRSLEETVASLGTALVDSAAADDRAGVDRLWRWRELHTEAAAALGVVHKADVTLPATALAPFVGEVAGAVTRVAPDAITYVFGHLADGNLHVNVVGPAPDDEGPIDAVLELVLRLGGSVSAEHGIGTAKRRWLVAQRGRAEVDAMRSIKAALDPEGILNPGVLLP